MEAFRRRKSSDRLREGNGRARKERNLWKSASDSSSGSSDTTDDVSFAPELRWKSSTQAIGAPIKKLLAEEMSRQTESKRRSPSVIARLMGFDGLPPQQPCHKQQKRSPDNSTPRMVSTERCQWSGTSNSRSSSRKSSKEEQEFKDVFEVSDTPRMKCTGYLSQGSAGSKLTEAHMAFIQQRFMEAKRLSTDEKLQDSKEFHDAIEDLDSNKDLLLKFLQQPDSMFTKHLLDIQGAHPPSRCSHISAVKASHTQRRENNCKVGRETLCKHGRKPYDDHFCHSCSKHETRNPLRSSKIQLGEKDESAALPTRIVVLKPNLGKMQNAVRHVSSPQSCQNFLPSHSNHTEHNITSRAVKLCGKEKISDDAGPSRYKSRESREISGEMTKKIRSNNDCGSRNISTPGFRGYAGDESSSNMSENESASELEVATVTPLKPIEWSNRYGSSSSRYTESKVSREARKRLSERWKMSHKSADLGVVSRSNTLGEMLAITDREPWPAKSDFAINEKGFTDKCDGDDGPAGWSQPLGISSMDGWKDGCISSLSRSRSVPASCTAAGSPMTSMRRETLCYDRYMMPKEERQREINKVVKGNFNHKEGSCSRKLRSRSKKSYSNRCMYSHYSETSPEISYIKDLVQSNINEDVRIEQNDVVCETSVCVVRDANSVVVGNDDVDMPPKPADPELSTHLLAKGNSSASCLASPDALSSQEPSDCLTKEAAVCVQHPGDEQGFPASSKETDQPSPVSVLETPFPDDLSSSSECFESLSADLHGLRMQLQLLKLESESYVEGPILSSDEDVEQKSIEHAEERGIAEESRELSYMINMLRDSGISDADPDAFLATWHSTECPVNPSVFEELEKKYCTHATWARSERRLLFDRINSALLLIYQQFADPHPWVRPGSRLASKWIKNGLEAALHKLLVGQEKRSNKDAAEKILGKELRWLYLGDDIDVIGREIERLLTEELVEELVAA